MKQFERIYENLDLIIFRADYIEGRSVEVAVSLQDYYYLIQHVDKEGKVENELDHIPIRISKAKKFREFLKEMKLLEWPTLKLGDKGYHDAPLVFSYGYDEEARSVLMRRLHMKQYLLEPCDVFTRNLRI